MVAELDYKPVNLISKPTWRRGGGALLSKFKLEEAYSRVRVLLDIFLVDDVSNLDPVIPLQFCPTLKSSPQFGRHVVQWHFQQSVSKMISIMLPFCILGTLVTLLLVISSYHLAHSVVPKCFLKMKSGQRGFEPSRSLSRTSELKVVKNDQLYEVWSGYLAFSTFGVTLEIWIITLTLARTCYFSILERTWGGLQPPHAISPLIEIELWDKDQTNLWDVLNPMVPGLTCLGHILTPPGRVKEKKIAISGFTVFRK